MKEGEGERKEEERGQGGSEGGREELILENCLRWLC